MLDADKPSLSLNEILGKSSQPSKPMQTERSDANGQKKNFLPYHSQSVPKPENLKGGTDVKASTGTPITTMMLRNIPNKYTQNTLLQEIDDCGFEGLYNFFYLPMDVHNRSNVGYAFINFVHPTDAERFRVAFGEHRFQKYQSRKISSACAAHVQGLDDNLRHFENRAVTHARNDQYRPIVFKGNQRIDFEEAVAVARARAAAPVIPAGDQAGTKSRSNKNMVQRPPPPESIPQQASRTSADPKEGKPTKQRERNDSNQENVMPASAERGLDVNKNMQSLNHDLEVVRQICQRMPPEGVLAARELLNQHAHAISTIASAEPMRVGEAPPGLPLTSLTSPAASMDALGSHLNQLVSLRQILIDQMQMQIGQNDNSSSLGQSRAPESMLDQNPAYVKLPAPSMFFGDCSEQDYHSLGGEADYWALPRAIAPSFADSTSNFSMDSFSGA